VDHREQARRHGEREQEIEDLEQRGPALEPRAVPPAERRERRAHDQRYEEQEAERENQTERQDPRSQQAPEAADRLLFRSPDAVEVALQLSEYRRRADEEQRDADDRRDEPVLGPT